MQRFRYSSEMLKRRKRSVILMGAVVWLVLPVWFVIADPGVMTDMGMGEMLVFCAFAAAASTVSFAISTAIAASRMRKLEVRLLADGIERQWGKAVDRIAYESIKRVVVGETRSQRVAYVELYTTGPAMYLSGLDRMDEVVRLVSRNVPETAERKEKKAWLDWSNSVATTLTVGLLAALIIGSVVAVAERLGGKDALTGAVLFAMGLWFLVFHPMSRGMSFRYAGYETALGVLAILVGVLHALALWLY